MSDGDDGDDAGAMISERLRVLQPDTSAAFANVQQAAWQATDPTLLALCRSLIARMLGEEQTTRSDTAHPVDDERFAALEDWANSPLFTAAERAHLAFTEQFVIAVGSVTDDDVNALLEHCQPREVYDFINALYVIDMSQRLKMVAAATIGEAHE